MSIPYEQIIGGAQQLYRITTTQVLPQIVNSYHDDYSNVDKSNDMKLIGGMLALLAIGSFIRFCRSQNKNNSG